MSEFDAVLIVSFGGPEGPDEVLPFLENVTRGRDIPRERLIEVGAHYAHFGGVSPINEQCRRIVADLARELEGHGHDLPVYWGTRNWHPALTHTIQEMADHGVRRALAIVTSAYSSYSGCRQYLDDIERARMEVGDTAPTIAKVRPYFDHPGFVEPFRAATEAAVARLGPGGPPPLVFTAHSIPEEMAASSDYELQLRTVAELVSAASPGSPWELVWQSRSGPPSSPWLEPDINSHIRALAAAGNSEAIVVPIGFVSDHIEVTWDLDIELKNTAAEAGLRLERVTTPGTAPDPRFITMLRQLVEERSGDGPRFALSDLPARPEPCATGCCPGPVRPPPSA